MPYISTAVVYPVMGKQGELRALLEERVHMMQSKGLRANLAVTAFGDAPAFYANIRFADLAAADAFRSGPLAPQADPAFLAKIGGLIRQPARNELRELMTTAPGGAATTAVHYNLVGTIVAQPAAAGQVLTLVLERVRAEQAAGTLVNANRPVAGTRGLRIGRPFGSLAELEKYRVAADADAGRLKFVQQLTPLLAEPASFEIREIIIPMSPA